MTELYPPIEPYNHGELKVSDITTADSVTLEHLIESAFRKAHHLARNAHLTHFLLDDYLAANHNFYITDKGIGFLYNPYEVSGYREIIEVFFPFSEFKGTLTPWFAKRMGL